MGDRSEKQGTAYKVRLWSRVRIQNVRANSSTEVIVVPPSMARPPAAIAADDPLAAALAGHKEGEWVRVELAGVPETIRILGVTPGPDAPEWWT